MQVTADVFQTQQSFRTILDCMSRPGKIGDLPEIKLSANQEMNVYLNTIIYTLFDREVSFCIGQSEMEMDATVQLMTMSRSTTKQECDFLIIDGQEPCSLHELKRGKLEYPDESASILCQVDHISDGQQASTKQSGSLQLTLSGPGIKNQTTILVSGLRSDFIQQFLACNDDYPLGIDAILIDRTGKIICLPRTVQIKWEVV